MNRDSRIKRFVVLGAGMFLLLAFSVTEGDDVAKPRSGPAGSWRLIGKIQARHDADHDVIIVKGPHDDFRRIKFKVTDAPLKIHRLVVVYDNGEPDKIEVREEIPQGGESRAIDLAGTGRRSIRKIEFWYETKGSGKGKADVTLFGMH